MQVNLEGGKHAHQSNSPLLSVCLSLYLNPIMSPSSLMWCVGMTKTLLEGSCASMLWQVTLSSAESWCMLYCWSSLLVGSSVSWLPGTGPVTPHPTVRAGGTCISCKNALKIKYIGQMLGCLKACQIQVVATRVGRLSPAKGRSLPIGCEDPINRILKRQNNITRS